jgi:hypothetical protein
MVKFPFAFEIAPTVVPFMMIFTPGKGTPVASVTVPVMDISWPNTIWAWISRRTPIRQNLKNFFISLDFVIV